MHRLEQMKETLMGEVMHQLGDLRSANSKELGEAVDMIKDLAEAIYYCQIVEAMKESDKEKGKEKHIYHYAEPMMYNDRSNGRMYYPMDYSDNGRMYYPMSYNDNGSNSNRRYYDSKEYPIDIRDYREGRAGSSRRMYMESKEMHKDKTSQMHELEKYMQELSTDITEMIDGASPEEKQLLQKKLSVLATKIV